MSAFLLLLAAQAAPVSLSDANADPITVCPPGADPCPEAGDIVVAARVPQDPAKVGQAVTVIDRDTIERRQTVVLNDLLATTAGVTVTRNGPPGGFTAVRIRGAEGEQTLTVIDGVRVNDPSSPGGGFDFANLLAGSVERVEVLRGANSVPWGSQAIGGVVAVTTETPAIGLKARAQAEYGSYDSPYLTAGVSAGTERARLAVTAGYLSTDGVSSAAVGTERDGYRQYGGSARGTVDIMPNLAVDAGVYYADSRAEIDGFLPDFSFGDTREYQTAQEIYGYGAVRAALFDGRFANRFAFTIADINRDTYDRPGGAVEFFGRGRIERYEYQGDARIADQLRLVFGAEQEDAEFIADNDAAKTDTTSFWGEAIVTPVGPITLTAGLRHDDNEDFGNHTTFAGNGVMTFGGTSVRASYAEGFKSPTLYQRFGSFVGNPELRPETARSWDAGVAQTTPDGSATVSATYFRRRTRNQIDFDLNTFTYANLDRTRAEGVELEGTLRPTAGFVVAAAYTYTRAKDRTPGATFGNDLARRPRDSVSVSADYRFAKVASLGATVTYVGDSFNDAANTTRIDGYVLTGIRGEIAVSPQFALYGRVDNLFDEEYETVTGYGTLGRAAYGGVRLRFQ